MEALKTCYEDVEEAFDEFVYTASETACYAVEHPEVDYDGTLETVALSLEHFEVDELLEEEIVEAQNAKVLMQDRIQKLEKEMKIYRETHDERPEEYFQLGDQFSEIKNQFREIDDELKDIIQQFDRTEKPEKAGPENSFTGKLSGFLPFKPKR